MGILDGLNKAAPKILDGLKAPVAPEAAPLDDAAINRRAFVHAIGQLSGAPAAGVTDDKLVDYTIENMNNLAETIRVGSDTVLRQQDRIRALQESTSPLAVLVNDDRQAKEIRDASYTLMQREYANSFNERENMATERRYVEHIQGLLATGNYAEAKMVHTLWNTPDAYHWTAQRQADMAYFRKVLEEVMPEEKDRSLLAYAVDLGYFFLPMYEQFTKFGSVDTPDVQQDGFDWLMPGRRLRNEAWALGEIFRISDPVKRAEELRRVALNMKDKTELFGWQNRLAGDALKSYLLDKAPSADETNAWALADTVLSPLIYYDLIALAKGAKAGSTSVAKTLKRAGLRSDAAKVTAAAASKIDEVGVGGSRTASGMTLDDIENEMLPSALNPDATPGDTAIAGALVDGPEDAEVVVKRLFGDSFPTVRLSAEELLEAEARFKAQVKKDFGRHVHDVTFETIPLAAGRTVNSPVVTFGTTKDSLFVTRRQAEEQMANLGLESAVVKEIGSENGVLYGIEARLPLSESQYYTKIDDTKPKNFLWRFLLGSRQTSSDSLYGLSEIVVAKRQKMISAIEREVNPIFSKLSNADKQKMLSILVKSEKEQRWFNSKELDILWARQMGIGDDVHEIKDRYIDLGDIPSPAGAAVDPEFLSQKAFAELKDRSAALGKQADDIFKASGEADEATFWAKATPEQKAVMDELTEVNAQIAKGPQKVEAPEIEAFLEPHTYKAWRAKDAYIHEANALDDKAKDAADRAQEALQAGDTTTYRTLMEEYGTLRQQVADIINSNNGGVVKRVFPKEFDDLWRALDAAADDALASQVKAGEQASRSTARAAQMKVAQELREATAHLDELLDVFKGGAMMSDVSGIEDMPSIPLYSFVSRQELDELANTVAEMNPLWNERTNGIRALELPGGRFVAWPGQLDFHDGMFNKLNDILDARGLPRIAVEDTSNIFIPVNPGKTGARRFGKIEIARSKDGGVWNDLVQMSYGDFARLADTYAVSGAAFAKRIRDTERRADKALKEAMTGGAATEKFRKAVDKGLTMFDTNGLRNSQGQLLHTNKTTIMSKPMEWTPDIGGLAPDKFKRAYWKLVELSNVEHLLRNEDMYLAKAARGFQTFSFGSARGSFENVDGIIYRAGSVPPVPSSRVYNISEDLHYTAKWTDTELPYGQAHRLTEADIHRMLKKENYVMVRLEQPVKLAGNVDVQWIIGKAQDIEVKPLKFEQLGYRAGGHRGYKDRHYAKQVATGRQGDNNEMYLKNPRTFIVGTEAEVKAWASVMEQARTIWNNTEDEAMRSLLLSRLLDGKPGFPSGEEFKLMVQRGEFEPEYPVEALYDREQPSDYAKIRSQGWDDMSDIEESGINTYMQTHGRMYTSPKGEHLPDWRGQDATLVDPFEMMNRSLNNIAALSSLTDYKMRAVEKWVKTFGQYLDTRGLPRDASPVRIFQESVFLKDLPEAQRIKNSAEAQRDTIKRVLGWRSDLDREFQYMGRQLVSFVAGDKPGKWNKSMARGMEWAMERDPVARARKMAFHMKLGLFNPAQFPMQISTMFAATSLHVKNGLQAMSGIPTLRGALGLRGDDLENWITWWTDKNWHNVLGFDDVEDFKEMLRSTSKSGWFEIGGAHSLVNYHGVDAAMGAIGNGATGEALDAMKKAGRVIVDKGTFFFSEAELWNRMVAWQMAWKDLRGAGLGSTTRRLGGLTPGTPKFYEALMQRANDLTINMTSAGAAAWQKGWASVPTQFLSYQARMLEAMLGKQFTWNEKLRLVLGQGILYGTAGVPFLAFANEMLRSGTGDAAEIGTWQGLAERGIIDTIIWGVTGGADIQYGERAAVGSFITDTFRELLGMSKYGEVSFVDIMGGPLWAISKDMGSGFWDVVKYVAAESGGDTGMPLTSAALGNMARNVSTINNAYKAYMVWNYGQYVTKTNKVALDDLPSTDAFAVMLGLAPGEYRDYVAKQDWRRNRSETVREVSDKIVEFRRRMERDPDNHDATIAEMEMFSKLHPQDIWIDAIGQANGNNSMESIADGLARNYERKEHQRKLLNNEGQ